MSSKNQPSPLGLGIHASKTKEGTIMKGKDGNFWIVKIIENGSHRWIRYKEKIKSKIIGKGPIGIIIIEPSTYLDWNDGKEIKLELKRMKIIKITNAFAKLILKGPRRTHKKYGYKYLFGTQFPTKKYKFAYYQGNDIAQIGIISVGDLLRDIQTNYKEKSEKIQPLDEKFGFQFKNKQYFKEYRKLFPSVLFIGETIGGDIGANVLVHLTESGIVDSLVLEI
jgi:hypothetical protein